MIILFDWKMFFYFNFQFAPIYCHETLRWFAAIFAFKVTYPAAGFFPWRTVLAVVEWIHSVCYWNGRLEFDSRSIWTSDQKVAQLPSWMFIITMDIIKCEASTVCGRQVAAWLKNRKIHSLSTGQGNLVNDVIAITAKWRAPLINTHFYNLKDFQCMLQ